MDTVHKYYNMNNCSKNRNENMQYRHTKLTQWLYFFQDNAERQPV